LDGDKEFYMIIVILSNKKSTGDQLMINDKIKSRKSQCQRRLHDHVRIVDLTSISMNIGIILQEAASSAKNVLLINSVIDHAFIKFYRTSLKEK
jgi:hypothetical protein